MSDWRRVKLDALGSLERGRSRHRPRNDPNLFGGDYPFFQTGDVKAAEYWLTDHTQTYNEMGLAQSRLWEPGTLCITIAANIAESAVLGTSGCFPDSIIGFIPDPNEADVRFVKYLLDATKLRIQAVSRGTTQDNLSMDKLLSLDFHVPSLETQKLIAAVLGAYDELIENNLRRIEILEEMTQAIYLEWFVNFRYPGHEVDEIVDSPLGPIPEGWEISELGEQVELAYGKALKKDDRRGGEVAVYGSSGVIGWHDTPLVSGPGIVVGRKGNVGSVHWSDVDFYPIDTTFYVNTDLSLNFVFQNLQYQNFINSDAAVPGLNRKQAYGNLLLVPTQDVLSQFDEVITPQRELRQNLQRQNANLRTARALLLPKLVSGEIDVSDLDIDTSWLAA